MGDAAHAMMPFQGSGAGQAVEDAMVLQTLFEHVKEPSQINSTLLAYDQIRRPRSQSIVASSKRAGEIMTGRSEHGLDAAKILNALVSAWDFIHNQDQKEQKRKALDAFRQISET